MIFETARFRVHTTNKSAWVEEKEPDGWVLREQRSIPLPAASFADAAESSAIRDALADFETSHPDDGSLRAVLTGVPEAKKPAIRPKEKTGLPAAKGLVRFVAGKKQTAWRQPLRPPLRPTMPTPE